ncbi:nitrate reductase molybdenum cofactor assembly chaperone [Prescottella subtropica]|uniref:nitrate reductase molybdenum cofactor assembly chaperone n=1 Tax=Prescottella subtropica TaxID=2545757 RepID=UPI0010F84BA0|nr:nitrate reductase molybdenum cofactor assembly chaperone [Prescottella subtropica]
MRLRRRTGSGARQQDRVVWQCASLLLAYPDAGQSDRLDTVETLLAHVPEAAGLAATVRALRALPELEAATAYVDTFDLHCRTTLLLTYWTDGDTRNRGEAMLRFARVYREAEVEPPAGESSDHLAVLLEFAATVDPAAGGALLAEHRPAIDLLRQRLTKLDSPYAAVLTAVASTLPVATDRDMERSRRLEMSGPPAESVGLQPFTLTVPPRRSEGVH